MTAEQEREAGRLEERAAIVKWLSGRAHDVSSADRTRFAYGNAAMGIANLAHLSTAGEG